MKNKYKKIFHISIIAFLIVILSSCGQGPYSSDNDVESSDLNEEGSVDYEQDSESEELAYTNNGIPLSEESAKEQKGYYVKHEDEYYRLQRGGEQSNVYTCEQLNMAATDSNYEVIPTLHKEDELVVFSDNLWDDYYAIPVIESFFTVELGFEEPVRAEALNNYVYDKTNRIYYNTESGNEEEDISFQNHKYRFDGAVIEEINGMSYDEFWEEYSFDTSVYSDTDSYWGDTVIKMSDVKTIDFCYHKGTEYCEETLESYIKVYGFNGKNDSAKVHLPVSLSDKPYATIDASGLEPGLYILSASTEELWSGNPTADVYIFEVAE